MARSTLTFRFVMSPVCFGVTPPVPADHGVPLPQTPQFVHVMLPELFPFDVKPEPRLLKAKQLMSLWGALPPEARLAGLPSLNPLPSLLDVPVGPGWPNDQQYSKVTGELSPADQQS